jgi:MFS family permease
VTTPTSEPPTSALPPTEVAAAELAPRPPAPRGVAVALRPFRHRSFSLLWIGGLISIVGSWMQTVAVGALVVAHTGKALWAVTVAASGFLPIGVLSPVGGAWADRLPRRPVLVAGNLVAASVALGIALLVANGEQSPVVLSLLVLVQGCVSALIGPFMQAILPDLVPREEFLAAVSLGSAQWNLGRVVGPALAGAAVAAFGYPVAFLANSVSFLAVVLALAFVRLSRPAVHEHDSVWRSIRLGITAARMEPACKAAILLIGTVGVLASPFIALVPAMARHLTSGGERTVAKATAVLTTSQGVGAVVGAMLIPVLAARYGRGRVLLGSLALLPPVLALYGISPDLLLGAVTLFVVGLVYLGVLSGLQTVVQLRAPGTFRGRVLALYLMALGVSYPIGSLVQGPIADRVGLAWTTFAGAALLALLVLVVPRLRSSVRVAAFPPDPSAAVPAFSPEA